MFMLDDLYRQVIIDHYRRKRNFEELKGENVRKVHYKNPTCGDVMTLFLIRLQKEKKVQQCILAIRRQDITNI